jgi:hypothetical protein
VRDALGLALLEDPLVPLEALPGAAATAGIVGLPAMDAALATDATAVELELNGPDRPELLWRRCRPPMDLRTTDSAPASWVLSMMSAASL